MNSLSQPLAVLFGYKFGGNQMIFVGRNGDIKLTMQKHRENLIRILALCDGHRTVAAIRVKVMGPSDKDFQGLIDLGEEFGIIRDSRELYIGFHEDSVNPLPFARNMSPEQAGELADNRIEIPESTFGIKLADIAHETPGTLLNLCSNRRSSRVFTGDCLTFQEISGLLRAMYTVGAQRSTPSAGQLYPLDIYLAVTAKNADSLAKGLYRYDPARLHLNTLQDARVTPDVVGRLLNSHQAELAGLVVFIAADLQRPASKYANRGYRYALLEAGHAAQNVHLYCAEAQNLGMVEYGGFQDKAAAEFLGLDFPREAVLLTLVVGRQHKHGQPAKSYFETSWNLSQQLIGPKKPIECVYVGQPTDGKYKLPRIEVIAKYRSLNPKGPQLIAKEDRFGSGLAVTSDEAMIKALAEAYERHVSGMLRVDAIGPAAKLDAEWLDPRKAIPLKPFAYRRYGWLKFDQQQNLQWVAGKRHNSGNTVMVPVDMVFYPLTHKQLGRRPCFSCTSNGVAAHTDPQIAAEKALLELVERDAISVTWYAKREVTALPVSALPEDIRLRMSHWANKGWQVRFLDLTLDTVPVVLATIYSYDNYPSFAAGAAANPNWAAAITKAWDEAEIFLLNWRHRKPIRPITPQDVYAPLDHGRMYFRRENLNRVKWLLGAKEAEPSPQSIWNSSELLKFFNPVLLDLTPAKSGCDLTVVRAISENLLPINFGYGIEHVGHKRLSDLGLKWKRKFPSFPHFFA
jgi:thiazole/oxazole-forming peptide maturase SagD family component